MVPGELGDRYWLIELLDTGNGELDPNFPFADPATTPGRMNAYEIIDDLSGEFDPCGQGAADSATTLFDSNNGGTGNMFDVNTFNGALEVTELDVNVDYDVGTQFTLDVLVAPGGWEATLTSPPGCVFNCTFDLSAWTSVASGIGVSAGRDMPSFVDIDDFILPEDSITGIWVTLVRDGSVVDEFRYTNGSIDVESPDITISTGAGVVGPNPIFGETVAPDRTWNGTIYYNTQ